MLNMAAFGTKPNKLIGTKGSSELISTLQSHTTILYKGQHNRLLPLHTRVHGGVARSPDNMLTKGISPSRKNLILKANVYAGDGMSFKMESLRDNCDSGAEQSLSPHARTHTKATWPGPSRHHPLIYHQPFHR